MKKFCFGFLKIFLLASFLIFPAREKIVYAEAPTFGVLDFVSRVKVTNVTDGMLMSVFENTAGYLITDLSNSPKVGSIEDLTAECTKYLADEALVMMMQGKIPPPVLNEARGQNCDYIIAGFLTNCGKSKDERVTRKSDNIHVDISVRIFDAKTGKVVFMTTGNGESKGAITRIGRLLRFGQLEFSEDSLNLALEEAVKKVVEQIEKNI